MKSLKQILTILYLFIYCVTTIQTAAATTNLQQHLIRLGSDYGGWTIPKTLLTADSICYCVGAGEDISFDIELITNFGCRVYTFDPTPKAIEHIQYIQEKLISNEPIYINHTSKVYNFTKKNRELLFFYPIGLFNSDTIIKFYVPIKPEYASYSALNLKETNSFIELKCKKLSTIMRELKHTHIDLLKLDIEGAEYQVIDDMMKEKIYPTIFCIEFHQGRQFNMQKYIDTLIDNGYHLLYQHTKRDFTFIRKSAL